MTYWAHMPQFNSTVPFTSDDHELMGTFAETIKGHNANVMTSNPEALKLISDDDALDLAADFADANAA